MTTEAYRPALDLISKLAIAWNRTRKYATGSQSPFIASMTVPGTIMREPSSARATMPVRHRH